MLKARDGLWLVLLACVAVMLLPSSPPAADAGGADTEAVAPPRAVSVAPAAARPPTTPNLATPPARCPHSRVLAANGTTAAFFDAFASLVAAASDHRDGNATTAASLPTVVIAAEKSSVETSAVDSVSDTVVTPVATVRAADAEFTFPDAVAALRASGVQSRWQLRLDDATFHAATVALALAEGEGFAPARVVLRPGLHSATEAQAAAWRTEQGLALYLWLRRGGRAVAVASATKGGLVTLDVCAGHATVTDRRSGSGGGNGAPALHAGCADDARLLALTAASRLNYSQFVEDARAALNRAVVHRRPIDWLLGQWYGVAQRATHLPPADTFAAEFGVFRGKTLKMTRDALAHAKYEGVVAGFDSFVGLPTDWRPIAKKGTFGETTIGEGNARQGGKKKAKDLLAHVRKKVGSGVELHKGWFQDTIPPFLDVHHGRRAGYVHVDGDLFLSAVINLWLLDATVVPGTWLLFDELVNYPEYLRHEILALWLWMRLPPSPTTAAAPPVERSVGNQRGAGDVDAWSRQLCAAAFYAPLNTTVPPGPQEEKPWYFQSALFRVRP